MISAWWLVVPILVAVAIVRLIFQAHVNYVANNDTDVLKKDIDRLQADLERANRMAVEYKRALDSEIKRRFDTATQASRASQSAYEYRRRAEYEYARAQQQAAYNYATGAGFNQYQQHINWDFRAAYSQPSPPPNTPPPPPKAPTRTWWQVELDLPASGPFVRATVMSQFKAKAKLRHPDHGGTAAAMDALLKARTEALKHCQA